MGLADYFHRSAIAAAQVLSGYDEEALSQRLEKTTIEVSLADSDSEEARVMMDLTVRLLARFYPRLCISGPAKDLTQHVELARAINPNIEVVERTSDFGIGIGSGARPGCANPIFAGSNGWDALLSLEDPQAVGTTRNPFGAGAAACLAVGEIFRQVFETGGSQTSRATLSTLDLTSHPSADNTSIDGTNVGSSVLVGVGAIGNAAVWALGRAPVSGELHLVDDQRTELSNLQRYVLCMRGDDDRSKVEIANRFLRGDLRGTVHEMTWAQFVAGQRACSRQVLVALDTAQGRRDVQASLPEWIANAWTQPGDLGVSVHPWSEMGACLACLYLPTGEAPGEDRVIGSHLGLTSDMELLHVRRLLHTHSPLPPELYGQVSAHLGIPADDLARFADRPLRSLYVEGLCGGAILPLSRIGRPSQDVHVPIAHQSALAGVLLGSRLVARAIGHAPDVTSVSRIDVLRPLGEYLTQPRQKDSRGICICQDHVYQEAFRAKYDRSSSEG
jgi:hypothetical protein